MLRDGSRFQPWGNIGSILSHLSGKDCAFVGCISMEDRCSSAYRNLSTNLNVTDSLIFIIEDNPSNHYSRLEEKISKNTDIFLSLGANEDEFIKNRLLDPFSLYQAHIDHFLNNIHVENLVLDITSLPKRVFAYFIKKTRTLEATVKNIIVSYTLPVRYCDSPLAENPQTWAPLPGFHDSIQPQHKRQIVISIGYEPLGLPDLLTSGEFDNARISLLFPFPSSPKRVRKNWKFARNLFPNATHNSLRIERVDCNNLPEIYDTIGKIGDFGESPLILAPFGPKPVSLAMALYASAHSQPEKTTSIYYTQPTVYHPDYSSGVKQSSEGECVNCYCIRINGNDLY